METSEIIQIKIHKEKLQILIDSGAFEEGEYTIVKVDVPTIEYSTNEEWIAAKRASDKAFKHLKTIEYNIRNR